jgi:hypothetical protein
MGGILPQGLLRPAAKFKVCSLSNCLKNFRHRISGDCGSPHRHSGEGRNPVPTHNGARCAPLDSGLRRNDGEDGEDGEKVSAIRIFKTAS